MNGHPSAPVGTWSHSFEEDNGEVLVFRPSQSFQFPASRRFRETLAFEGDTVVRGMPGPDDRTRHTTSSVTPLGGNMIRFEDGDRSGQVYEMVEVQGDKLTLRPH